MSKDSKQTPMMGQYWELKNSLAKDTMLLFRLGDFYEMFFEDAVEGSRILGITLTKRLNYPMAGIPYHSANQYIPKLLDAGIKVAICEQDEAATTGKLVKRSISRILTPGTALDENQLSDKERHNIFAVDINFFGELCASWLDLSTGEFFTANFENPMDFLPVLSANNPREMLLPEEASKTWPDNQNYAAWHGIFRNILDLCPVTLLHDYIFDVGYGSNLVLQALNTTSLSGFGLTSDFSGLGSAGAIIYYATENLRNKPQNLRSIKMFQLKNCMIIDSATQRNLEIFKTSFGTREGSLLGVIDKTKSSAGARMLESYLAAPSIDIEEITFRQNVVSEFVSNTVCSDKIADAISRVKDLPRILGRLQNRIRNPRELGAILASISEFSPIKNLLEESSSIECRSLGKKIHECKDLISYLQQALQDELPSKIQDGSVIRERFDEKLDYYRDLSSNSKNWLADFEYKEQQRTGIKNLKIRFNGSFGYSIEVTKSFLNLVPDDYIRRQTLTSAERYTTELLREKESEILNAEENAKAREAEIFENIIQKILEFSEDIFDTANTIATVDVLSSFARLAREYDYTRPVINEFDELSIEQGRHPVIEQMLRKDKMGLSRTESFVPNNTFLSSSKDQIALITGPNMAGKSTYIRQVALIAILAQIGCYVPARQCTIGIIDRVFSRVGASDELSRGNSTFMVEMNETANILNNATKKSLIVLDEIGRGTSTYDGLSIAWAVIEYLHKDSSEGPKTLFATHYHELTKLEGLLERLVNYRVCVREWKDSIIFIRTIEHGAADKSYGIQVAKLAGLPAEVIDRANEVLENLETEGNIVVKNLESTKGPKARQERKKTQTDNNSQLSFL